MTRVTEDERRRWIAALARRIRRLVGAKSRPGRIRAEDAAAPPRDRPHVVKEGR